MRILSWIGSAYFRGVKLFMQNLRIEELENMRSEIKPQNHATAFHSFELKRSDAFRDVVDCKH